MDREDENYLNELIKEYNQNINQSMFDNIKKIWCNTIEELVYYREPLAYDRTYQLRDKFKVELRDGIIYAYVDTDSMEYYSFGRKDKPVSGELITHIIDVGHNFGDSPFGETDYLHNYPARHMVEEFASRVKNEYPQFEIEIYRNTPSI